MPSFKKIISAVCAASMLAAMSVVPVFAESTTYYEDDFESFADGTIVDLANNANTSYEGYEFHCGTRDGDTGQLGVSVSSDASHAKYLKFFANKYNSADRHPYMTLTKMSDAAINNALYVAFDLYTQVADAGFRLTDGTNSVTVSSAKTGWATVTVVSQTGVGTIVTYKDENGALLKEDKTETILTNITEIHGGTGTYSGVGIDNLVIMDASSPSVSLETVDKIEVGEAVKVATVEGADDIQVAFDPAGSFSSEIRGNEVYVTATAGGTAKVTVTGVSDVNASKSLTITAIPAADFAQTIADELVLTGSSLTDNGDGKYDVSGGFTVPIEVGAATVEWTSNSSAVSVSGTEVTVNADNGGEVELTATINYKGNIVKKVFILTLTSYQEYYNENFNSWTTGEIVKVAGSSSHENTTSYPGWSFYCGSRADGGDGGVSVVGTENKNLTLNGGFGNSNRNAHIVLTNAPKASDVTGALITQFKMSAASSIPLTLSDGKTGSTGIGENKVDINLVDLGLKTGTLYDVTYAITKPGSEAALIINDADGNTVVAQYFKTAPKTISRIDIAYNTDLKTTASIDDFSMYKTTSFAVPQIDVNETDLIFKGASAELASVTNVESDEKIKVELGDSANFTAAVANGKVTVSAKESAASGAKTTVKITAEADISVSSSMEITTLAPSDVLAAEKELPVVLRYAADARGELLTFNAAEDNDIISNIVFPTTSTVSLYGKSFDVGVRWTVTEGADNLNLKGEIAVSDMNAHPVKLTRTTTFSGASDSVTYDKSVKFNVDEATEKIKAAVEALNPPKRGEYTDEEKAALETLYEPYLRAFVYDYQVKFDAALASNFSGIPTSFTGNSSFTLPKTGVFGSEFTWYSSSPSVIGVSSSTGAATVKQPTYTTNVTITASISAKTAKTENHTVNISVAGTGGSSSLPGGGSTNGGSTRPGSSSGGGVATSGTNHNVSVTTPGTTTFNPNPSGFTDLGSVSWALTAINNLYVNGVISGKTATTFCPNDNITRAEFAKILVNAFNIPIASASNATFSDVSAGHWASDFVETAYSKGIITGYDNGTFDPDANVTRQDMAVMILRAAEHMGYTFEAKTEPVTFTDAGNIAAYAKDAVETLQKAGIANGVGDGAYEPLSTSTRAQACQMIYNVFNK